MGITDQQIIEAASKYKLNFRNSPRMLWGTLAFSATHHGSELEIFERLHVPAGLFCSYEVEIHIDKLDGFGFPVVFETNGDILANAESLEIDNKYIHINDDNSCCLGIFPEYTMPHLSDFIKEKVIPFFYYHEYLKEEKQEPWRGYAHEEAGLKEYIKENKLDSLVNSREKIQRNTICPCGSCKKFKKCCWDKRHVVCSLRRQLSIQKQIRSKEGA